MARSGALDALVDFAGAMLPLRARNLQTVIDDHLSQIPNKLNEYGYDAYGMSPLWMRRVLMPFALLYRYYFRVEVSGIDRLPEGRVLVIANHAGQLPFDAAMLGLALLMEAQPPRIARSMGEYWIPQLPWVSVLAARIGALVGTPQNCIHMLANGECVLTFPEGVRGMNKVFSQRYQLQRFGTGFMRLALETATPIVPVAIVGSEEQQPSFANLEGFARMFGAPALPITATFPWLGPLGLLPLPVKYRIYFGEPQYFDGEASDEDAIIDAKVEKVKAKISGMLARGRREREGIFS
jgi:1-acyl-sn-glycerol-3-phosphate acyltransferase